MLVLSRKQQEEIAIGENIKITVIKIKGNTVRLGIEAPRDVKVIRGELPRHSETVRTFETEVNLPESQEEQIANVTVVFTDPVDRSSRSRSVEADVLKFDKSSTETCSINFRQTTPAALKHNRLKQIVSDIAKSK